MTFRIPQKPILTICGLIILSGLLRFHAFNSPVGGSHVWLSAHVVLTSLIWDSSGIDSHNFSPVYTFPGIENENMRSLASGISDTEGNYYYVSYPPFSFLLAYIFFKVFFLTPSLISLQLLNIFLQGVTAYLMYLTICELYHRNRNSFFPPGTLASVFYIFSTQSMWCHVYMYFADTLIQLLWSACILVSFIIFQREGVHKRPLLLIFGCINFLSVYTEWLGLFFSVLLFCYSTYKGFRNRIYFRVALIVALSTALAIFLTLWQYSSIDGFQTLISASTDKYLDRSGISQNSLYYAKIDILRLLNHYWRLHKANLILILFFSMTSLVLLKGNKSSGLKDHLYLIIIITLSILMHHAAFLEFSSMHDFSTLKSLILICFLIAFLYNFSVNAHINSANTLFFRRMLVGLMGIILFLNILIYYSMIDFRPHSIYSVVSHQVITTSPENAVLFGSTINDRENGVIVYMGQERAFSTQIQLLTQRNILGISGPREAITHMNKFGHNSGILYNFDQYGRLVGIDSFKRQSK